MTDSFFKKAMRTIRKANEDTVVRVKGRMLYLVESKPKVISVLQDEGFGMALYDGEAQVLQPLGCTGFTTYEAIFREIEEEHKWQNSQILKNR